MTTVLAPLPVIEKFDGYYAAFADGTTTTFCGDGYYSIAIEWSCDRCPDDECEHAVATAEAYPTWAAAQKDLDDHDVYLDEIQEEGEEYDEYDEVA